MIAPEGYIKHLKNKKKLILSVLLLVTMIFKIDATEMKECIIKNYYPRKIGKFLTRITKMRYNSVGRVVEEKYYLGLFWDIVLSLRAIVKYEYPDKYTKIEYAYKHSCGRKVVFKYDEKGNLIRLIGYDLVDNIFINKWNKIYSQCTYELGSEYIYKYNEHNDLIFAEAIRDKFVNMPGPLKKLPNDGLNGKYEEFKYEYDEKGLKIKVFGKSQKKEEYLEEWRYFYNKSNNIVKKEKYVMNKISSYIIYKYNDTNLLIEKIAHTVYFHVKEKKQVDKVMHYYSYDYYPDGKLKRKNKHNHMDFDNIEDMKIWSYDEYTYK